ncbi:hypothetical protein [Dactylosporangium sp. NPDC051484]|uniref:hypothetical protein n=1 Tax=Dactylosporangium sp. NPDC051484 TaxID=3154942 RepID=UPI00344DB617
MTFADAMMCLDGRQPGEEGTAAPMARFEAAMSVDGQRADVVLCGDCDLAARDECTTALMTVVATATSRRRS